METSQLIGLDGISFNSLASHEISSSDLIHLLILDVLILVNRNYPAELERFQEYTHPLTNIALNGYDYSPVLLCYLNQAISMQSTVEYANLAEFQESWVNFIISKASCFPSISGNDSDYLFKFAFIHLRFIRYIQELTDNNSL
jgi:hypothetical protein